MGAGNDHSALADEIEAILAKSAKEPGVQDLLSLMQLSSEATGIQHIQAQMAAPTTVTQSTGTPIMHAAGATRG